MLQDQIFASEKWLSHGQQRATSPRSSSTRRSRAGSTAATTRRSASTSSCEGLPARGEPPGLADERDQRADLAVAERHRPARQDAGRRPYSIATTYKVLKAAPSDEAYRTDLAQKALDRGSRSTPRARASRRGRSRSRRAATRADHRKHPRRAFVARRAQIQPERPVPNWRSPASPRPGMM